MSERLISQILCDATEEVLWSKTKEWALSKKPDVLLKTRVGNGFATNHHWVRGSYIHTITYGKKMVEAKRNTLKAKKWLTSKEILKYSYFNGEVSFINLMAHTCIHEYSHFIQTLNGWRLDNSVHNENFYRIVSKAHLKGTAEEVKGYIIDSCERKRVSLEFFVEQELEDIVPKPSEFTAGSRVSFEHNLRTYYGLIKRVNKLTLTISLGGKQKIKIPYELLDKHRFCLIT
jgi:hypothetical protein